MSAEDLMLPCLSKKTFGVECFGCGTQRAFLMVLDGKFSEAYQLFPAIYPLLLFFGFAILNFIDQKRNYGFFMILTAVISAIVMVVSYFIRHFF